MQNVALLVGCLKFKSAMIGSFCCAGTMTKVEVATISAQVAFMVMVQSPHKHSPCMLCALEVGLIVDIICEKNLLHVSFRKSLANGNGDAKQTPWAKLLTCWSSEWLKKGSTLSHPAGIFFRCASLGSVSGFVVVIRRAHLMYVTIPV